MPGNAHNSLAYLPVHFFYVENGKEAQRYGREDLKAEKRASCLGRVHDPLAEKHIVVFIFV